ncbi:MAG: class I SAM-dependent methyltransferase [Actinobacteria bacterium]|nr:class I SAM-dependent methyltransferase [Actinomycetota bacterium]
MRELDTPDERRGPSPGKRAADDHWSGSRRVVQVRPHVWNWLAPRVDDGSVLEIGPGLRPTAPVASSTFIDASAHALNRLAARGGRTVPAGETLPFPDGSFDAVLAFEVLEHVDDDTGLIHEIARVSRPGGMLIMSTPVHASMWSPLDDACGHMRRDEPEVLFEKVRSSGFEIGGYTWTPSGSPRVIRLRARALTSNRRLSTAFVQTLIFPFHAAYQRMFAELRWSSPTVPVPLEADDVMLWATRSAAHRTADRSP